MEEFARYQTSQENVCGCSQNQSQGIELDVQKDKGCAETKGIGPTKMGAGGWLCGMDVVGRGGLGWHDSHGRQPLELNESTKLL